MTFFVGDTVKIVLVSAKLRHIVELRNMIVKESENREFGIVVMDIGNHRPKDTPLDRDLLFQMEIEHCQTIKGILRPRSHFKTFWPASTKTEDPGGVKNLNILARV